MGIGFVLLIWAVLLGCAALPVGLGLGVWSWRNQRTAPESRGMLRPIAAAALPFVLLVYCGATFIAYAIWCEEVRHVDAGIGDSWAVPVGDDHFFCMIDVPDDGYLLKGGCSGAPAVSGITELAEIGDRIVGNSRSRGPFVLDTRSGAVQTFATLEAALGQFSPRPSVQTAKSFYLRRRWGWADLAAGVLTGVPAAGIVIVWYRRFIRAPRT